jgi:chemotaxis-related protein WspB
MLFLMFRLGNDRYAIEAREVVELLPLLSAKQIPHAPPAVRGVFDFRGQPVPLIDMTQLALGHPVRENLSTRIVLVRHPDGRGGERLLGLMAEHVTETLRRDAADFRESGVELPEARWLGPVASHEGGLVQWLRVDQLLTPELCELLFPAEAA